MNVITVKNDKKYKVTIKVKGDDGIDVDHILEPDQEIDVPKDQGEAVLAQISEAKDPDEKEETDEEKKAREDKEAADKKSAEDAEAEKNKGKTAEQIAQEQKDAEAAADKKELSELRKKDRVTNFERKYESLLKEGKITPAQKDKFMSFAEIETQTVSLSEGKTTDLAELMFETLNAGSKVIEFDENGSGNGKKPDEDAGKKPSEKLTDEERAGLQAVGVSAARMDELAEKDPVFAAELAKLDEKEE